MTTPGECQVNAAAQGHPGWFAGLCGYPATVTVQYGCIHEHINEERVCTEHAERLSEDLGLVCSECWKAGHQCRVMGRVKAETAA